MDPSTQPISYRAVMFPCMLASGLLKSLPKRLSAPTSPDMTPATISRIFNSLDSRFRRTLIKTQQQERLAGRHSNGDNQRPAPEIMFPELHLVLEVQRL